MLILFTSIHRIICCIKMPNNYFKLYAGYNKEKISKDPHQDAGYNKEKSAKTHTKMQVIIKKNQQRPTPKIYHNNINEINEPVHEKTNNWGL